MENSSENMMVNPNEEYIEGEEIYCRRCGEARTRHVIGRKIRILCSCQRAAWEKEQARAAEGQAKKDRLRRTKRLKSASLLTERYANTTFGKTEPHGAEFEAVKGRCEKYVEIAEQVLERGIGIYLYGDAGTGKTHLSACIANELVNSLYSVLFTNLGGLSRMIKDTFRGRGETEASILQKIREVDFLIIDDLGSERVKKDETDLWTQELLFTIVNERYSELMPIIFTSNYSLKELAKRGVSVKTLDRIAEICEPMKLSGKSFRSLAKAQNGGLF